MLLNTSPIVQELNNPIDSGLKKWLRFVQRIDDDKIKHKGIQTRNKDHEITIPGLDVASLQNRYGPENAYRPRLIEGTFRIPVGTRWTTYEKTRNDKVAAFVNEMKKMGFSWVSSSRIKIVPGVYPARDVMNKNMLLLDQRECIIQAYFVKENPETYRLELDPTVIRDYKVNAEFARQMKGMGA